MQRVLTTLTAVATVAAFAPMGAHAQDMEDMMEVSEDCYVAPDRPLEGRASPKRSIEFTLGGDEAVLCWDAPSLRDRVAFGRLIEYGELWRLGANEATAIHLTFPAEIGGVEVPADSYSLYAIPGAEEFEFFLNTGVERWGIQITDDIRESEVGSFTRPVMTLEEPVEQMRFFFEPHGENMGHLVMEWENTRVEIPIHRGM